ncbi:2-hydroxyacid dehydrogenase [Acrocarpospora pleiomorpha]|uniref:2-hydroxyacid dehydrogenase n=1 Tax=Acrocarpospora pleiomorpha TaxID=90975 RepID=A0A5M3XR32_9ACTN|nr:virulence RhuM family protein [Acrocarpospora pleiomorpha]GES21623.1 2-hydroxyacid dehydrogenase [Acrocarpospora pleiomorpha]
MSESGEQGGEIILYRTEDGHVEIQFRAVDGTVWLSQAQMAELFDRTIQNINLHILAILKDGEVSEATIKQHLIVRTEGSREVRRQIQVYNLDMILAVGYRVRSARGSQFRTWATTVLREYLVKGFVLNDQRLKDPGGFDYFDELLERIREIRASEKRFYQKLRDLFAAAGDYDPASQRSRTFFATVQNKLIYAVTGHTAAELTVKRADLTQPNMGLTSWKGSRVRKGDVGTAKNYLSQDEITDLNMLTTQFLDFAELRTRRRQQISLSDWMTATDRFIGMNEMQVLTGVGRVSHEDAERIAHERYLTFDEQRRALESMRAEQEVARDEQDLLSWEPTDAIYELEQIDDGYEEE